MRFALTKKDIVAANECFDTGSMLNEPSLDFALNYARRTQNWTKALAYVVRAILMDHVFEEGNKRTALAVIKAYAEFEGYETNNDVLLKAIKEILLKRITSIARIEEMIKHGIKQID